MALSGIHLTPQLVQAVRDAVEILDIAREHTKLRRSGRRWSGLCPLHKEKTPSFSVDPDQGLYYCFGCGRGGDAIRLHMELSGDDFPAAIESLARRYGIPLPARGVSGPRRSDDRERRTEQVLARAEDYFREQLRKHALPREYLESRRISAELTDRFRLGFAPPGWRNLFDELGGEFSLEDLERAGLAGRSEGEGRPYDRFRCRLIFPVRNASGRLVGFGGRALDDDRAKYVNTPETSRFQKRMLLYGLDLGKRPARESGRLVLVEGYFDLLALHAAGIENAAAGMGTSLTEEQARLAARFADEVVLAYDGDEAGVEAARRALPLLLAAGLAVRRAELGPDEDPDSLRLATGEEALAAAVEEAADLVEAEVERLTPSSVHREPRQRAIALARAAELLAAVADPGLRQVYARQAAGRLGLPVSELLRGRKPAVRPAEPAAGGEASPVRGTEERVIELLLDPETDTPALEELPPPEVFFEPLWRNIYGAFCAIYERDGAPPPARTLLAELGEDSGAVDRVSRIVLEFPVGPGAGELERAIVRLHVRWWRQRLKELTLEIEEAERRGDRARLQRLLAEREETSAALRASASPAAGA